MTRPKAPETVSASWFTPLAIIAGFLSLTELVVGVAITQVTGCVQVMLALFVMIFPTLIASAFFAILWSRPHVFYSPAEYGKMKPKDFVEAMRGHLPQAVVEQMALVGENPKDETANFELMNSLIEVAMRQHLILMKLKSVSLPLNTGAFLRYETGTSGKGFQSGIVEGADVLKKLAGTNLVDVDADGPSIKLTPLGHEFADWLIANGKKNEFYASPIGGWGEPKGISGAIGLMAQALTGESPAPWSRVGVQPQHEAVPNSPRKDATPSTDPLNGDPTTPLGN